MDLSFSMVPKLGSWVYIAIFLVVIRVSRGDGDNAQSM